MLKIKKEELPEFDGYTAYNGAIRFFDPSDESWTIDWRMSYGNLFPNLSFFAADAFGILYGLNKKNEACIFNTETGDVDNLKIGLDEFLGIIANDPDDTIHKSFYEEALAILGRPSVIQNFAYKIELALGGEISVENLYICDRDIHLRGLGKVATQIKNIPIGTKLDVGNV